MSSTVTSVFTFKVESTFDEWAAIFDSKEATRRHREFNIQPLYRGCSDDDPQKIIVIHQPVSYTHLTLPTIYSV